MATKLAPGVYQLSPAEGLTVSVSAVGTGFAVIASVDMTALSFPTSGSSVRIGPEMMNGMGSVHSVNIRCFFTQGATQQSAYQVSVTDDKGSALDVLNLAIVVAQPLPYQALVQLVVAIQ
jgi:hypothetical protein